MADGTTLDPGTGGDTIYTDEIASGSAAGTKVQGVKLGTGANGSWTEVGTANPVPVSDAGGSLTVDGTVAVSGTVPVSDGGSTISVDDGAGSLTVDGTVTANAGTGPWPVTDNAGSLTVDNGGTFATQESQILADNAGFTDGTTKVFPVGLIFDEVAGTALTENDVAAPRIDSKRAQIGVIEDATTRGQRAAVSAGGALKVDGSAATQPVSGTVTANAGTNLNTSALATESGGNLAAAAASLAVIDDWDETDRAKVNPIAGQAGVQGGSGAVSALTQRVVLATDVALPAGTNAIGKLAANSGVDIGDVDVTSLPALPAGNNNIGDVDVASIAAGSNAIGNVGIVPRTSGGLTIFRSLDLDETEEEVKASAGQLFGWYIFNAAATTRYVKLYDATAAGTTVGTTTPILTLPVPAGAAANVFTEVGIPFSTALSVAATTGVADADTGAPSANDVIVNLFYA